MKRSKRCKYPHSVNLFLFCQNILAQRIGRKIQDQDVGALLEFNPSDCSHWKRGEKNIRSIHAFSTISSKLDISIDILQDIARGKIDHEEALFEVRDLKQMLETLHNLQSNHKKVFQDINLKMMSLIKKIHTSCNWQTAPLYFPELLHFFPNIQLQKAEIFDRLTRILRKNSNQFLIQHRKNDMTAQTRTAIAYQIGRILASEQCREAYPVLGPLNKSTVEVEAILFALNIFSPNWIISREIAQIDIRKNIVHELANTLWIPRSVISYQLSQMVLNSSKTTLQNKNLLERENHPQNLQTNI